MMRIGRKNRHHLRQLGEELRREDPLLAAMLSDSDEPAAKEPHPENSNAPNRAVAHSARRRAPYTPFIMF
jgi:hypothetical protein